MGWASTTPRCPSRNENCTVHEEKVQFVEVEVGEWLSRQYVGKTIVVVKILIEAFELGKDTVVEFPTGTILLRHLL